MYPILFEYNNFQISTYGFMLMMAFIICNYLLKKYLTSINVQSKIGEDLIFYAAIGGILGAKIFYIIEYYNSRFTHFSKYFCCIKITYFNCMIVY